MRFALQCYVDEDLHALVKAAADAATSIQEEISVPGKIMGTTLEVRIGFHYGEVIQEAESEKKDVFGDAVNLAARVAAQAKASQILTTGDTLKEMGNTFSANERFLISDNVKGKTVPVDIFELTWGAQEDLTVMGNLRMSALQETPPRKISLRYRDQVIELDENQPSVTIGRGASSGLHVPDSKASRLHCKIELNRGNFYLSDQSTNGTYLENTAGESLHVYRDEVQLTGKGMIGLGEKPNPQSENIISYEITG